MISRCSCFDDDADDDDYYVDGACSLDDVDGCCVGIDDVHVAWDAVVDGVHRC